MKKFIMTMGLILGVLVAGSKTVQAEEVKITQTVYYNYTWAYEFLDEMNKYRQSVDPSLPVLKTNQALMEKAMKACAWERLCYNAHQLPNGTPIVQEIHTNGGCWSWDGENDIRPAVAALEHFICSPGHNAYMLQAWDYCGVGFVGEHVSVIFYSPSQKWDNSVTGYTLYYNTYEDASTAKLTDKVVTDSMICKTEYLGPWYTYTGTVDEPGWKYTVNSDGSWTVTGVYGEPQWKSPEELEDEDKEKEKNATPAQVTGLKLMKAKVGKKTQVFVMYNSVKGCNYQIQLSTDKKFKKSVKKINTKSTSKGYTKAYKGKKVYVRVRAYKKVNGKTVYGKWSKVKSVKSYK